MELPLEILHLIFSNLSRVNLAICRRVCLEWYNAIKTFRDQESMVKKPQAVCLFLEQNDIRNAKKLFHGLNKTDKRYIEAAVKSGSYETVLELKRSGFTMNGAIEAAIKYHHNEIFINFRIIAWGDQFSFKKIMKLCVRYGNVELLKKLSNIMDIDMDILFDYVVKFDQCQIFQWMVELNYLEYDVEKKLNKIAGETSEIIRVYFENVRKNKINLTLCFLTMLNTAMVGRNYCFFKYGWNYVSAYEIVKKCSFLVTYAFERGDYYFWEKLLDYGLSQVVPFDKLIKSSLPTEVILKYLNHTNIIKWKSKYFVNLIGRDNIDLMIYAKKHKLAYDFDCYQCLSIRQREWVISNGYPIILPYYFHSNLLMGDMIANVLGSKGACYIYQDVTTFYQFIKPFYESHFQIQIPDMSILDDLNAKGKLILVEFILSINYPKCIYYLNDIQKLIIELSHFEYYYCLEIVLSNLVKKFNISQICIVLHIDDDDTLRRLLSKIDITLQLKCNIAKELINMNRYGILKWLLNEYQCPEPDITKIDEDEDEEF